MMNQDGTDFEVYRMQVVRQALTYEVLKTS
jgi:hypothetical protein